MSTTNGVWKWDRLNICTCNLELRVPQETLIDTKIMQYHARKNNHFVLYKITLKGFLENAPFGDQVSQCHFNSDSALGEMKIETILILVTKLGFCKWTEEFVTSNVGVVPDTKQRISKIFNEFWKR